MLNFQNITAMIQTLWYRFTFKYSIEPKRFSFFFEGGGGWRGLVYG